MAGIPEPIFLQALWRTGSTYLFGKFRTRDELRCYFEPLHESLFCKTREKLLTDYQAASKKFGHNSISHNYYDEFNVRAEGGVAGFKRRFTLENYVLGPDEDDPELEAYIQGLIDHAEENGQRAVMQFNRGVLRAEWMRERFEGTHIYLNRNPSDMLSSYRNKGYYLPVYLAIIGQNAEHPVFQEIAERYGVKPYDHSHVRDQRKFTATFKHFARQARGLAHEDEQDIVAFFWTLGLAQATRYADVIIDTDQILEPNGRTMPELLGKATYMDIDFSDISVRSGERSFLPVSFEMKGIIQRATEHLDPQWAQLRKFPLSSNTSQQLFTTLG